MNWEREQKDKKKGKKPNKPAIKVYYSLSYRIYLHRKSTEMKLTEEQRLNRE